MQGTTSSITIYHQDIFMENFAHNNPCSLYIYFTRQILLGFQSHNPWNTSCDLISGISKSK